MASLHTVLSFCLLCPLVVDGVGSHVCHGSAVPPGQFQWLVRFSEQPQKGGTQNPEPAECTGSLVGPQHVLTAAHCIKDTSCVEVSGECVAIMTDSVCIHPSWDPSLGNGPDLAVVTLPAASKVAPLSLIDNATAHLETVGQPAVLAGFGFQCGAPQTKVAQYTDNLTIINRGLCQKMLNAKKFPVQPPWNISTEEVCTQDNITKSGAAVGDSGGPLFQKVSLANGGFDFVQFGVVHGGEAEGIGLPDVYTRVLPNVEWIHNVIGGRKPKLCQKLQSRSLIV